MRARAELRSMRGAVAWLRRWHRAKVVAANICRMPLRGESRYGDGGHHMKSMILTVIGAGFSGLLSSTAQAHVSIASGPAFANVSQEVAFGVGHGCAGADTVRVQVEIPEGVTSVRPEPSDFGQVDVETDATGAVVSVTWTKSDENVLDADTQYYKLLL